MPPYAKFYCDQCVVCKKSFTQCWNVKEHMIAHVGEKSHKCKICKKNKSFRQRQDLSYYSGCQHQCKVLVQIKTLCETRWSYAIRPMLYWAWDCTQNQFNDTMRSTWGLVTSPSQVRRIHLRVGWPCV